MVNAHREYWLEVRRAQRDVEKYGWHPLEAAKDRDIEFTDLMSILGTDPPPDFETALRKSVRRKKNVGIKVGGE